MTPPFVPSTFVHAFPMHIRMNGGSAHTQLLFCVQEPVTITLGTEYHYRASGTKRRLVEKCETFQYVPFLENLEWMLQNPDICHEVHV